MERIRDDYVPAAGFSGAEVFVTGAPAFNVDFIDKAYGAFPGWSWRCWCAYLLLLRAFRSVFLPVKAVFMNLLSVARPTACWCSRSSTTGGTVGLHQTPQIEAWIPIFLFAMLFGLSMDYEVFLLSRMREEWDAATTTSARSRSGSNTPGGSSRRQR